MINEEEESAFSEKFGRADMTNVRKFVVSNSLSTDPNDGYGFESIIAEGRAIKKRERFLVGEMECGDNIDLSILKRLFVNIYNNVNFILI